MNPKILLLLPIIGITTFFTLLFTYTKLFGPIPFYVTSVNTTKSTTFDVTGEGKVSASPDIALVNVGVVARGDSAKSAQDELNKNINKVSEAIKKLGVEAKDIQTANYSISPAYDYNSTSAPKITGYNANTNLAIKVRKIDNANSVLDVSIANGANSIGGINFTIDDKSKLENQAREKAVAEAKKKAEDAAKIAGFKLGRIINYSENNFRDPRPIPMMAVSEAKIGGGNPTQVEPGSSEITITVTLSFDII